MSFINEEHVSVSQLIIFQPLSFVRSVVGPKRKMTIVVIFSFLLRFEIQLNSAMNKDDVTISWFIQSYYKPYAATAIIPQVQIDEIQASVDQIDVVVLSFLN